MQALRITDAIVGEQPAGLEEAAELLRFTTAGSVDDGKSTLIGRLLYDTKTAFEDQLRHVEDVSRRRGDERTNLALLTDGLRAEREQGITIDVAYRYFATKRRPRKGTPSSAAAASAPPVPNGWESSPQCGQV